MAFQAAVIALAVASAPAANAWNAVNRDSVRHSFRNLQQLTPPGMYAEDPDYNPPTSQFIKCVPRMLQCFSSGFYSLFSLSCIFACLLFVLFC